MPDFFQFDNTKLTLPAHCTRVFDETETDRRRHRRGRRSKDFKDRARWEVIYDPTGTLREGRSFFGDMDMRESALQGVWADGTIFRHERTRKMKIYRAGKYEAYDVAH